MHKNYNVSSFLSFYNLFFSRSTNTKLLYATQLSQACMGLIALFFAARRYESRGLCHGAESICPFVCL